MFATHAAPDSSDHHPDRGGDDGARPPIDYRPLRTAGRLALVWLLDVARTGATEPDDLAAVERVERAALASVADMPMCCRPAELRASEEDVLVTAAILVERFEIDFRIPGLSQIFGALYEAFDWSQRSIPPKTCGVRSGGAPSNHATHRHADAATVGRSLAALLAPRAPRVAHGPNEAPLARAFGFPTR